MLQNLLAKLDVNFAYCERILYEKGKKKFEKNFYQYYSKTLQ